MFKLSWREHMTHEWILEGQFPDVRSAITYLATDSPFLVGQYKIEYDDIEVMRLDMNSLNPTDILRRKLTSEQKES